MTVEGDLSEHIKREGDERKRERGSGMYTNNSQQSSTGSHLIVFCLRNESLFPVTHQ